MLEITGKDGVTSLPLSVWQLPCRRKIYDI